MKLEGLIGRADLVGEHHPVVLPTRSDQSALLILPIALALESVDGNAR
jgi:hypothetical protein